MNKQKQIQISSVELKHFRCFKHLKLDLQAPYILLEGANGTGKTSILEALYYACYLRSFRTYSPRELVAFDTDGFFVKVGVQSTDAVQHDIQIGFSKNKRLVKVDQKPVASYKELMSYYRIISLTEEDLALVQGSPQCRRLFIDQMLLLLEPSYGKLLKEYRQIVDQRNAFLHRSSNNQELYKVLTQQLWSHSRHIEKKRTELTAQLSEKIGLLRERFIEKELEVKLLYRAKQQLGSNFEQFYDEMGGLQEQEFRYKRSLIGAHLDDINVKLSDRQSRLYASRGQQKLIVLLLKVAQLQILAQMGCPTIFLLDDFMTDFDEKHAQELLLALESLDSQLIFTSPVQGGFLSQSLKGRAGQIVKLTH